MCEQFANYSAHHKLEHPHLTWEEWNSSCNGFSELSFFSVGPKQLWVEMRKQFQVLDWNSFAFGLH
jgi:hypothetical protein